MNKMKRYLIYIALLMMGAMMMIGCEKEITFNDEETESKVVMRSLIEADSTVSVNLMYSQFFLNSKPNETIDDAEVKIYINGTERGTGVSVGDGDYEFDVRPMEGDSVMIEATTKKGETVRGKTLVPKTVLVSDIDFHYIVSSDEYESDEFKLRYVLHDPADVANYYKMRVVKIDTSFDRDGNVEYTPNENVITLTCTDNVLVDNEPGFDESNAWHDHIMFSDDVINGKSYTVAVEGNTSIYVYENHHVGLYLVLEMMSKDSYLYQMTVNQFYENDGSPFAEPVMVHSNIEGGIGYVGAIKKMMVLIRSWK